MTSGAHGRHRRSRTPAGAIGAAIAVAVVSTALAASAVAGESPASVPEQAVGTVRLDLVDQTFAVVADGSFRLDYRLTGLVDDPLELEPVVETTSPTTVPATTIPTTPSGDVAPITAAPSTTVPPPPPPPLQLTVEVINYAPLSDPAVVAGLVGHAVEPGAFDAVGEVVDGVAIDLRPLATRTDDGTVEFSLDVGTDVVESVEDRLKFDRPGLYPIRVQVLVGNPADDQVIATAGTIVQRLPVATDPAPAPPIDLAVVAATDQPPPDADPAVVADAADSLESLVDLAATVSTPLTLRLPPTVVADEAATTAGAERLAGALADDELVAMPIVPLDVSSAVAADRAASYTRLVNAGQDLLVDSVPTTPVRREVWIADAALSAAGAQHLRDLGTRVVVMDDDVFRDTIAPQTPATDQFVEAILPDGGRLPMIVVDPLAEQLDPLAADQILARSTSTEWAVTTLATMLADQQQADALVAEAPGGQRERSRVLSAPGFGAPDGRLLDALDRLVETTPSARFTAASSLAGVTDVQVDERGPIAVELPAEAGPALTDRIALLEATTLKMVSAASMLPDDDPRPAEWTNELDALISTGYTDAEVITATAELVAEADQLVSSVVLPEPFTFTLTGRSGTIELRIGNTADEPLDVAVHLESTKVTFPDGDQTVTLQPLTETAVTIPVEARSNGTSPIELFVSTPGGEQIGAPVSLTARITALTGLGQVLTAGFVLVLVTWWFSHWRSRRRAALVGSDDDTDDTDDTDVESDARPPEHRPEAREEVREVESDSL